MIRWRRNICEIAVGRKTYAIVLVDGTYVRDHRDSDFVQGGNGYRYRFISKNEIWIDRSMPSDEIPETIVHEIVESEKMRGGMSYERAHDVAKRVEDAMRRGRR